MSSDALNATPTTRKRTRAAMQATDPAAAQQVGQQQPPANDGFVVDNDAVESGADDDEEEGVKPDKKAGRRKIKIEFIQDKSRRHITFSKRKAGIMKKAYELSTLTGTQVLLLVVSETGLVYTFTTAKLQPLVTQPEGKNLIQACLNAPHGALPSSMPVGPPLGRSAPQQMQTPSAGAPGSPGSNAQMPGMAPPPMGARNVPGGLAIGGGNAASSGAEDDNDGGDRGPGGAHEETDVEGDKRGSARRRTSAAGNKNAANVGAGGRSPTSPSPHMGVQPAGGMPGMSAVPGYGGAPVEGAQATGPPAPGAGGAQMYGHPVQHHGMMGAPPQGYYQPPTMPWPQAAPQGAPAQTYNRR